MDKRRSKRGVKERDATKVGEGRKRERDVTKVGGRGKRQEGGGGGRRRREGGRQRAEAGAPEP